MEYCIKTNKSSRYREYHNNNHSFTRSSHSRICRSTDLDLMILFGSSSAVSSAFWRSECQIQRLQAHGRNNGSSKNSHTPMWHSFRLELQIWTLRHKQRDVTISVDRSIQFGSVRFILPQIAQKISCVPKSTGDRLLKWYHKYTGWYLRAPFLETLLSNWNLVNLRENKLPSFLLLSRKVRSVSWNWEISQFVILTERFLFERKFSHNPPQPIRIQHSVTWSKFSCGML